MKGERQQQQQKGGGAPKRKRPPTKQWLVEQCERMQGHVLARQLADAAEVKAAKPAGNAHTIAWVQWYGQLRAWVWAENEGGVKGGPKAAAEERLLRALNEEPEPARLLDGRTRQVYCKGLHALLWFRARSWLVDWLAVRLEALRLAAGAGDIGREDTGGVAPPALVQRLEEELAHQLATMVVVACHPGPGLPAEISEAGEADPKVPQWARDMDPLDLFMVHNAFMEANVGRMEALEQVVPPEKGRRLFGGQAPGGVGGSKKPMSWNVFMGTMATRLHTDPATLAKDRSLVALLAQVRLGAAAMAEQEAAEALGGGR